MHGEESVNNDRTDDDMHRASSKVQLLVVTLDCLGLQITVSQCASAHAHLLRHP